MGFLDDLFNLGGPKQSESEVQPTGLLDGLFNLGGPKPTEPSRPTGGFLGFGQGSSSDSTRPLDSDRLGGMFSYREPILPGHTQARGYGDEFYDSQGAADKSRLIDGVVTDPHTGYVGTPGEIYDRYVAEGRDPSPLLRLFRRRRI